MRFGILGPFVVADDEGRELALGGRKQRSVLAILLLHAGEIVSSDRLIEDLWGEGAPATAGKTVQVYVSNLRKVLADGVLVTRAGGYVLQVEAAEVDSGRFQALVAEGREALQAGEPDAAAGLLRGALGLWRGRPFADFAYEPFAQSEIARLEEARVAALEDRIDADLTLGAHVALVGELEVLIREHPLRERLRGQLMLALYRADRQADALAAYRETRELFRDELGLEPGTTLQELQRLILRQDRELDLTPRPARKQLNKLPVHPTPFLGRRREVSDITALLDRSETRLLTLTGAGGSGKTRLAHRIAEVRAEKYRDGTLFVGFADITDPRLITETICRTLGLPERPDRTSEQRLEKWLAEREIMLLLDNLEQLAEGAGVLARMLATCPGLTLLVTSREPLHLAGEQQYEVPLLEPEDAIDLFVSRARAVVPQLGVDRGIVGSICERLDHLPLAIELAAAKTKAFPVAEILARLDKRLPLLTGGPRDAPLRQRTLRATIDWSYDLLNLEEQQAFARLAVFIGGCTLAAAENVCAANLDTLQTLVDRSLLRTDAGRYRMLETLHEYALEQLEKRGETDELRRKHHKWFSALLDKEIDDRDVQTFSLTNPPSLDLEHENINAALAWALEQRLRRGRGHPHWLQ